VTREASRGRARARGPSRATRARPRPDRMGRGDSLDHKIQVDSRVPNREARVRVALSLAAAVAATARAISAGALPRAMDKAR
jgi:hypothetical protein